MADGWIKLHRQLQDCPIWYSERFSKGQAWVDLLMMANHSSKTILFNGKSITIERGQMITSMVKLSEKWKWDRKTVSSFLKLLESEQMISRISDNSKTVITIENYNVFQGKNETVSKPYQNKTQNKFNKFSQRKYNFDTMEKNLVENNK